ncbi:enoyl-CoA hydratase/isomerase family protein [Comamonas sp. J-3]|uniref:enoyl-CoA hydratase/isomerase family protein n=1 Tax=Comamonas trifloxystrobinivorans TaxID=3350256 RepID=UPI003728A73E
MKSPFLTVEATGSVATITLTQPDVRNAFSDAVIADITRAFEFVGAQEAVRAVVLAAEGPAFCAGANLNWMRAMADYTREENLVDAGKLAEMLRVIYECPKPTIARVQGDVYAGGMGLVACCDMAVAANNAGFCLSEVKIGLIPATISPYVIRAMGPRASHRYFLTGERFDAAEALRIGFVHQVVEGDALDAAVDGLLKHLLSAGPAAVRACKKLVLDVAEREINASLIQSTVEGIADIRASAEGKEGVQAFLNKRKPNWLAG